ncbi:MAG: hypothetical protein QOH31_6824 [Verrucomicrobiota bacterium]
MEFVDKLAPELICSMNSTSNWTSRIFLILALACAMFVGGTEIQAASTSHRGGRLIVQRAPNFGTDLSIHLSIDGKEVANIPRDQRYDGYVSAGRHMLTVVALPNTYIRQPTSMRLTIRSGRTYVYTAGWDADRLVLRRSALSNATLETPTVGRSRRH